MTDCKIIQGDSVELVRDLADNSVGCVIADPPYGVAHRSYQGSLPDAFQYARSISNDGDLESAIGLFHDVMRPMVRDKMKPNSDLYVFTRWDIVDAWMGAVRDLEPEGLQYKMMLIWDKGIPGMGDIDANWGCGHEIILYCKKGRRDVHHRRSAIIHVDRVGARQHVHPTEKPVGLMSHLIAMSTDRGDLVVDPFSGSGASIVAAQRLHRNGIGFEMDEGYVRDSRERLTQLVLPV